MNNVQHTLLITTLVVIGLTTPSYAASPATCANAVNIKVNGLVCDFCARSVEKLFGAREEVAGIKVNLDAGQIDIDMKTGKSIDDKTLNKLIKDSGFDVTNIKRGC
ncbi:MAG: heavy metal-associated domain-containing protein [Alphaproteobacteria bacterium]|nr:heavy metal-associated domain-containing protein [Alphaproteobacteria bacterium]